MIKNHYFQLSWRLQQQQAQFQYQRKLNFIYSHPKYHINPGAQNDIFSLGKFSL